MSTPISDIVPTHALRPARLRRAARTIACALALTLITTLALPYVAPALVGESLAREPKRKRPDDKGAEATRLNDEAKAKFKAGNFKAAAELFMKVYDLAGRPAAVFNAAKARAAAGELREAKSLYELYMRIERNAEGREAAAAEIARLEMRIKAEEDKAKDRAREAEAKAKEAERKAKEAEAKAERALDPATLSGAGIAPARGGVDPQDRALAQAVTNELELGLRSAAPGKTLLGQQAFRDLERRQGPTVGECDIECLMRVARSARLGHLAIVTLTRSGEELTLSAVLWRTFDASPAGRLQVVGVSRDSLHRRAVAAFASVLNPVRVFEALPAEGIPPDPTLPDGVRLAIDGTPARAEVFVDEIRVGALPATVTLRPGHHRLRVAASGHEAIEGNLNVEKGGARRLLVRLGVQLGTLWVDSDPANVEVLVDGRPVGRTPIRDLDRPVGSHRVELRGEGIAPHTEIVALGPTETARVRVTLSASGVTRPQQPPSLIEVKVLDKRGQAVKAAVRVDGRPGGVSPLRLELPAGAHTIEAEAFGLRATRAITVAPGIPQQVVLTLAPASTLPNDKGPGPDKGPPPGPSGGPTRYGFGGTVLLLGSLQGGVLRRADSTPLVGGIGLGAALAAGYGWSNADSPDLTLTLGAQSSGWNASEEPGGKSLKASGSLIWAALGFPGLNGFQLVYAYNKMDAEDQAAWPGTRKANYLGFELTSSRSLGYFSWGLLARTSQNTDDDPNALGMGPNYVLFLRAGVNILSMPFHRQ